MGSPIHATPADRLATRTLASAVLEAIRDDEAMPLPIGAANAGRVRRWLVYDKRDAESLIAQLCGEIVELTKERDEAFRVLRRRTGMGWSAAITSRVEAGLRSETCDECGGYGSVTKQYPLSHGTDERCTACAGDGEMLVKEEQP